MWVIPFGIGLLAALDEDYKAACYLFVVALVLKQGKQMEEKIYNWIKTFFLLSITVVSALGFVFIPNIIIKYLILTIWLKSVTCVLSSEGP